LEIVNGICILILDSGYDVYDAQHEDADGGDE
jgi:hypothetical protein